LFPSLLRLERVGSFTVSGVVERGRVGFMMVGGGAMFSNRNKIGRYFSVDASPLPASLTFSATTTTEGW